MSTEAGLGHGTIETVLANHRSCTWLAERPKALLAGGRSGVVRWSCGMVADRYEQHDAAVVRVWLREALVSPEVVDAARRAYTRMQHTRDDDPAFQSSMVAALAATAETLGAT